MPSADVSVGHEGRIKVCHGWARRPTTFANFRYDVEPIITLQPIGEPPSASGTSTTKLRPLPGLLVREASEADHRTPSMAGDSPRIRSTAGIGQIQPSYTQPTKRGDAVEIYCRL